jgi:hypothetical protein
MQHPVVLVENHVDAGEHPHHGVVPRLDRETELFDARGASRGDQCVEESTTQPPSLELVDDRDRDLGHPILAHDVAAHSGRLVLDDCPPGDMADLVDLGQIAQLRIAEIGDPRSEPGKTALL